VLREIALQPLLRLPRTDGDCNTAHFLRPDHRTPARGL